MCLHRLYITAEELIKNLSILTDLLVEIRWSCDDITYMEAGRQQVSNRRIWSLTASLFPNNDETRNFAVAVSIRHIWKAYKKNTDRLFGYLNYLKSRVEGRF